MITDEQKQALKKQLLKKGAEINEKLTKLLAGEKVDIERLLGKGKPGMTPIERLRRFMAIVDGALARIRRGTYGTCEQCGAALPYEHLGQIPWIDTCQACAAKVVDADKK